MAMDIVAANVVDAVVAVAVFDDGVVNVVVTIIAVVVAAVVAAVWRKLF